MRTEQSRQYGFTVLETALTLVIIAIIAVIGWLVFSKNNHSSGNKTNLISSSSPAKSELKTDPNTPPLKLKSIGFNLDYYNPATGMAGDIKFVKYNLFNKQIRADFGQQDPRTPDPTKKNPQPTFYLPLSTPVRSIVDGVVTDVKILYSGDSTIMVAKDEKSAFIYETEHVTNVKVKKGDRVTGSQILAGISPHGSPGPGIGVLEIGILHPQGTAAGHVCPFKYLDDSIKAETLAKITALHKSWEQYLDQTVYKESFVSPGCVTEDWVRG